MIFKRIGEALGAEIGGIDLARPLDEATFREVAAAFFEHQVVVFRDQHLTPDQQVAFTARFGELERHVRQESCLRGFPQILVVSNLLDEAGNAIGVQDAGRFWHSDLSYKRQPSLLSALYALEVPVKEGRVLGDTDFASAVAAYEGLPPEMKRRLDGVKNVHSYRYYRTMNAKAQNDEAAASGRTVQEHTPSEEQYRSVPDVEMPVVRTHPVTRRKALFVNEAHTSHLVGMEAEESARVLRDLYRHIVKPEFTYRHHWRQGDLLMWDNCAVQHRATFDYRLPQRRLMHRTTVRGAEPF